MAQKKTDERVWMRVEGVELYHLFSNTGPRFMPLHPGWRWTREFELASMDRDFQAGPGKCMVVINPAERVQCPTCRAVQFNMKAVMSTGRD